MGFPDGSGDQPRQALTRPCLTPPAQANRRRSKVVSVPATLYFDVGSPFVYLALERLDRFDFGELEWRPVSLGALFKYAGRSAWGLSPRRVVGMAEVEARARAYGLPPIMWPD